MDVRCERCRAQYVFDDDQVTPTGLTVQCTNCGHVFKVKKKELVVTVPVKPDEMDAAPLPATAAAPRPGGAGAASPEPAREPPREWRLRQANGNTFTFRELTTLQKWIIEQKVSRDDEISLSGEQWKRLGNIAELASFFQVVEAAERGKTQGGIPAVTPLPMPAVPVYGLPLPTGGMYPPPPSGYPPPSFTMPLPVSPPAAPSAPEPRLSDSGLVAAPVEVDLGPEELAVVKKGRGLRIALAVVLLLAVAGAAAYVLAPQLFGRKAPEPLAVPITIEVKPQPVPATPPPEPAPPPAPVPEPVAAAPVEPPPAPVVQKPVAPKGPKALLAQAERLREKGETEEALDLYGRVADEDPENVDALTGRGLCYLDLEQYPPAEASFQAALQIDPKVPDALLGLAETYRWQGKKADAIRYYERYLAADPDGEEAEVARNALEELRK
jgi:predicted Zn finger-like uncharacterized protein